MLNLDGCTVDNLASIKAPKVFVAKTQQHVLLVDETG